MVYVNNLLGMTVKMLEGLTGLSKLTVLHPLTFLVEEEIPKRHAITYGETLSVPGDTQSHLQLDHV